MKERQCVRCGKRLGPGSLVYVAQIKVFADFDGVIPEPEGDLDSQMRGILEQIQESDPKDLEKEVYEEFRLLLCKSCRDRFVDEAQHPWEGPFLLPKGPGGFLH